MHPQAEQESVCKDIFLLGGEIWRVGVVHLVVLACFLRPCNEDERRTRASDFDAAVTFTLSLLSIYIKETCLRYLLDRR